MNNKRLLKNARLEHVPLSQNNAYTFSSKFTLLIYPLDAVCTFIPKNTCSSLRYSIALANYTFVILRCPYTRIASCFFDKIVGGLNVFKNADANKLNVNFYNFLRIIRSQNHSDRNKHWRNQSDFLHYEEYDEYFSLESLAEVVNTLDKRGFIIHDIRSVLKHDLSSLRKVEGDFSKTKRFEIKKMKEGGYIPSYKSMFTIEEIELVKKIYNDDLSLYVKHFGKDNLLFE